jgi:hypothetical protein
MFETICDSVPADAAMPARVARLDILAARAGWDDL